MKSRGVRFFSTMLSLVFPLILALEICSPVAVAAQADISQVLLERRWKAVWVCAPEREGTTYGVFHFRKGFELALKPEKFIIHLSADNRYKLYVNGQYVCNGPSRGDLLHWRFESVDIAGYLKPGKNIVAAVVWNFGEDIPLAQITYSTAFLVQGDTEREAVLNTDETWKVVENEAYSPVHLTRDGVRVYNYIGSADRVDGERYPWGWEQMGFDDNSWPNAVRIFHYRAVPREAPDLRARWLLVPRMIPLMEYESQAAPRVRRASGIEVEEDLFIQGKPLIVPAGSTVSMLLDQTHLTTAYPEIILGGGKDAKVRVTYAEALYDSLGVKGHRDQVEGKKIRGYYDEFLPDGGGDRLYTSLWFRTFRYIQLDIETAGEPLTVKRLGSTFTAYPFREEAAFSSDDSTLEKIWEVSWRTARLCAGETYFDCPYYEQLNYVGDTRVQALISLYVSGDDRLMREAIKLFDDSRISDGLTYSRYPSNVPQIIPPYSLFWIVMVHDYWMFRDDPDFVRSMMPGVRNVIEWFERHLSANGLLDGLPWWNFVDWAPEYHGGVCPGAGDQESSVISLQYVYALRCAAELASGLNMAKEAEQYSRLASSVAAAVREHCWSESRGLVAETPCKEQFSQHANTMAILAGLVPQGEQPRLFEKIIFEKDLIQCTFYFRFYLLRALKKAGLGDRYIDMLGPWYDMLEMGLTTFAEKPEPARSDCHAWSASPIMELLSTVAGIEPASPGFRSVRIEPHMGKLQWIKAAVPHPAGKISCSLDRRGEGGISGEVILPDGLSGTFIWNDKEVSLRPGVQRILLP